MRSLYPLIAISPKPVAPLVQDFHLPPTGHRVVRARAHASFRRGSRVGQGTQRAFRKPIDHRSALVPADLGCNGH